MKEDEYKKSCIEMNNEEHSYKMSIPMFEVGELETFDNNIHSIVEEYSKLMFKEKDQILTQRIIMKQEEEIERLNNIIKEVRENINKKLNINSDYVDYDFGTELIRQELLKILDKGE